AAEAVEAARKTVPAEKLALVLAPCYEALGEPERARPYHDQLVRENPIDLSLLRNRAAFLLRTGQVPAAREELDTRAWRAAGQQSMAAWARRHQALLLATSGDYKQSQQALELLSRNLRERPNSPEDQRVRALILASRPGGRRESIQTLESSFAILRP